jgi:hypothetical protein
MAPNTPSYESILRHFRACRGLYILGAGASAAEAPFGDDFVVGPALDYVRHSGSFPAIIPRQSELNQRIIRVGSALPMSRIFPYPMVCPGNDFLYQELLQRLPGFHARLFMKHDLFKYRFSGRQSGSYRVFQLFHSSLILNYNLDGLATDLCGTRHRVVDAHGTVKRGYGSACIAALVEEARELDVPSVSDDLLMCVPASYGDTQLAKRLSEVASFSQKFSPDFVTIIGYSFGCNEDFYDDRVSLDFVQDAFREFRGKIYVINPEPDTLRNMLAEGMRSKNVIGVRAYWNVLAHSFMQKICGRNERKSLNYMCEHILDTYGSRVCFPLNPD